MMSKLSLYRLIGGFGDGWRGTRAGDSAGEVGSRKKPAMLFAVCVLMYVTAHALLVWVHPSIASSEASQAYWYPSQAGDGRLQDRYGTCEA